MTLTDVTTTFRRGWWLIVLATVVCGVAGTLYGTSQSTTYSSTTHGYVVVNNSGTSGGDAFNAGQAAQSRMASYAALATTPAVTSGVATALQLTLNPEQVAEHLAVSFPPGTLLLDITATADTPQLATDLAAETLRQLQKQVQVLETPAPGIPQWARLETVNEPTTLVTTIPSTWTFIVGGIVGGIVLGIVLAYFFTRWFAPATKSRGKRRADEPAAAAPQPEPSLNGHGTPVTLNGTSPAGVDHAETHHTVPVGGREDESRHSRGTS